MRDSWFKFPSVANNTVLPKFFVAVPFKQPLLKKLYEEREKFSDVVICPNVNESYNNLPLQTLEAFRFFTRNIRADYILKASCPHTALIVTPALSCNPQTDDDVFVKAEALAQWLRSRVGAAGARQLLYAGWIVRGAAPHRTGRWAVAPADYPDAAYPPYASGPAYLLSGALGRRIVRAGAVLPPLRLEDVSVALWVRHVQVWAEATHASRCTPHARRPRHAHTCMRARARTHARTHTRTHTHTHTHTSWQRARLWCSLATAGSKRPSTPVTVCVCVFFCCVCVCVDGIGMELKVVEQLIRQRHG